jgi:hypothetical protein
VETEDADDSQDVAANLRDEGMADQAEDVVHDKDEDNLVSGQNETAWEVFVNETDNVNDDTLPNLQAYVKAKQDRLKIWALFEQSLDECMSNLKIFTDEMLSEGATICMEQASRVEEMEDYISNMVQSNHARRNHCLKLVDEADGHWKKQRSILAAHVLAEVTIESIVFCDRFDWMPFTDAAYSCFSRNRLGLHRFSWI